MAGAATSSTADGTPNSSNPNNSNNNNHLRISPHLQTPFAPPSDSSNTNTNVANRPILSNRQRQTLYAHYHSAAYPDSWADLNKSIDVLPVSQLHLLLDMLEIVEGGR